MNIGELEKFVKKLYNHWKDKDLPVVGMAVPLTIEDRKEIQKNATSAEKRVLKKLRQSSENWVFCLTPYSKTPADIIGVRETETSLYFLMIQVKSGKLNNLKKRDEKQNMYSFSECLKVLYSEEYKNNKNIIIAYCYVLVPSNEEGFKRGHIANDELHYLSPKNISPQNKGTYSWLSKSFGNFSELEKLIRNRNYGKKGKTNS